MPAESTPASQPPEAEAAPQPPTRPAPRVATGGTLFERMSNLSRGNARTTPNDEEDNSGKSGLDIPRFLNRQNNQSHVMRLRTHRMLSAPERCCVSGRTGTKQGAWRQDPVCWQRS